VFVYVLRHEFVKSCSASKCEADTSNVVIGFDITASFAMSSGDLMIAPAIPVVYFTQGYLEGEGHARVNTQKTAKVCECIKCESAKTIVYNTSL